MTPKTLKLPAVQTYLEVLLADSRFNEIHEFEIAYLEMMDGAELLEIGPHPRATVLLERLMFEARSKDEEFLITHIRDLRALAWRSAIALKAQGFENFQT